MRIPSALYARIVKSMPVFCVDLVVRDPRGRVLLVKRANAPARGQWWLPGGRVLYHELRVDAARRKLLEECGLTAGAVREVATFDVILPKEEGIMASHTVATVFDVSVPAGPVRLDAQSTAYRWRTPAAWAKELGDGYVVEALRRAGRLG